MPLFTPSISMRPSAHYVTQGHIWGIQFTGKLTDHQIRKYQRAGYYGREAQLRAEEAQKIKAKRKARQTLHQQLHALLMS